MTDNRDDILIKKFFEENITEIEDNGFSRRVMRRLPGRASRTNRIWTALCAMAGIAVFIIFRGWEYLTTYFYDVTADIFTMEVQQINPVTLAIATIALAALALNNYVLSEE